MATGPIETHLHRSFNWENAAPGPREGPRGRSANCGNGLFAQCVRLRSEINRYKKAWFEYDGTVQLGVDVAKVNVSNPDENNVVTITVPDAEVLGQPQADESTFSDIYSDTGLLTPITTVDQSAALEEAQNEMIKSAEGNSALMSSARERAKTLLSQYVTKIGDRTGKKYEVQFKDAE